MIVPVRKIGEVIREAYQITKNPMDAVPFAELVEYLRRHKVQGSDNKLARDLSALGLGSGFRKEKGEKVTLRTGLRLIHET